MEYIRNTAIVESGRVANLCPYVHVFGFFLAQKVGRLQKRQVKWQEFLRSLEKQRDCWNSWRPCGFVEQWKKPWAPVSCVFFFWGGRGLYYLYSLGIIMHSGNLIIWAVSPVMGQRAVWFEVVFGKHMENFKVINEKQPENRCRRCLKQMCEAVAVPCCSYVYSFSFLGHVSFGVSHLRRITTERFHQKTGGQLSTRRLPSWWQISIIKVDIFPDAPAVRNIYVYSYHKS